MSLKNMDENFSIHYPSLKYFSQLSYVDPRMDSKGRRVNFEKEGVFNGQEGHYVMYEDENLPGKFIAVHIPSSLNEDDEEGPGINVVAVDKNAMACANRMKYRMRKEAKDCNK